MLFASGACAPSPRILYQGNATFEYCYAADREPSVTTAQRESCWQAWLAHYTRHQNADRVDYALRRIEALQFGDLATMDTGAADPEAPEDAERTEQQVADDDPIRSQNSLQDYATQGTHPAKKGCKVTCEQLSLRCLHACQPDFEPCLDTCANEERICLGGCY